MSNTLHFADEVELVSRDLLFVSQTFLKTHTCVIFGIAALYGHLVPVSLVPFYVYMCDIHVYFFILILTDNVAL